MPPSTHVPAPDAVRDCQPSEQAVRLELDVVLNSAAFRKSDRLTRFLRYICEKALTGQSAQLNEVLIAHEVFDRGAAYSPGDDSVVRRQAYSLRQKLQDFYVHEGCERKVRIDLPVGRYVPVFTFVSAQTEAKQNNTNQDSGSPQQLDSVIEPPSGELLPPAVLPGGDHPAPNRLRLQIAIFSLACLLIGLSAGWFAARHLASKPKLDAAFFDIWGGWLSDSQPALICFSTPLTASIQQVSHPYQPHGVVDRIAIAQAPEAAEQLRKQLNLNPGGYLYLFSGLAHAKMGEALGTVKLSTMLTQAGVPVRATESRFLRWDDFRNQNIIILGHVEANAWVSPVLQKLPLQMASTTVDKPRRIVNAHPAAGERSEYFPTYPDGSTQPQEDYALISMINSVDGRHRLAVVSGVNSEGTQMGLEYLSDPASLRVLADLLHRASPGQETRQFQFVLHGDLRDRMPMKVSLLLLRPVS